MVAEVSAGSPVVQWESAGNDLPVPLRTAAMTQGKRLREYEYFYPIWLKFQKTVLIFAKYNYSLLSLKFGNKDEIHLSSFTLTTCFHSIIGSKKTVAWKIL